MMKAVLSVAMPVYNEWETVLAIIEKIEIT